MICLDSEARHLKQRPFSGLVINVNKNTGAGYSPITSIHCVNVAISKTSITFKSVFFIRCRRSDSSIFVDKWNLTAATIARSFSQRPQAAIRQLRTWPRIHVQPRFQWGFRNGVTFLRVVYSLGLMLFVCTWGIILCNTFVNILLKLLPPHLPGVNWLSMWEKITFPMYRSWFHDFFRLHGLCCPQKPWYSLPEA